MRLAARAYPRPGRIVVSVDLPAETAEGAKVRVSLQQGWPASSFARKWIPVEPSSREEVVFDVQHREPGPIHVTARLLDADGDAFGPALDCGVQWPGRDPDYRGIDVQNNFVWQLIDQVGDDQPDLSETKYKLSLPIDRFLYVRSYASIREDGVLWVFLDSTDEADALVRHDARSQGPTESMRFVPAGEHTLTVLREGPARINELTVHAIPAIQYSQFPASVPHVQTGGNYNWRFVKRDVLPAVNMVIVDDVDAEDAEELAAWRTESGRSVLAYVERPDAVGVPDERGATLESLLETITARVQGEPLSGALDGLVLHGFGSGDDSALQVYETLVRRLPETEGLAGLSVSPYVGGSFGADGAGRDFADACLASGGRLLWQGGLPTAATECEAVTALRRQADESLIPLRKRIPDVVSRTVWVVDASSYPWPQLNVFPEADFNAWIDMQFQFLATHPAFFGLGGIQVWRPEAMSEESMRLMAACYEHYCIKGQTGRLLPTPYALTHLRNPDFTDGLEDWDATSAKEGALEVREDPGYALLQGRNVPGRDAFLCLTRDANAPNVIAQTLENLLPGRTYVLSMISADYGELKSGSSKSADHGLSVELDHVSLLTGETEQMRVAFPTRTEACGFTAENPLWLNLHRQVFQARRSSAELRISDWDADGNAPLGAAEQTLMLNFIEVRPYFKD
jgi:hypothetical protein